MDEILEELNQTPGMLGCMIVGSDGLVIAQAWDQDLDADFLGASIADIYVNADSTMREKFLRGELNLIMLEASNGKFLMRRINDVTFLMAASDTLANLGLIRNEMKEAAERLKEVL